MIEDNSILQTHEIVIDTTSWEVSIEGKPVTLTKIEFRLLHFLASRPGFVKTRQQIIDAVQGPDCSVTERWVDVQVVGLRQKLGNRGRLIETVRGFGYRFESSSSTAGGVSRLSHSVRSQMVEGLLQKYVGD